MNGIQFFSMKTSYAILSMIFFSLTGSGQTPTHAIEIDTLEISGAHVLAEVTFWEDNKVSEIITGRLIHDTITAKHLFLFKRKEPITIIKRHGISTRFLPGGSKEITRYDNDVMTGTWFTGEKNNKVSEIPNSDLTKRGPCGTDHSVVIITGRLKKKQ
jgi:hypothetical protein